MTPEKMTPEEFSRYLLTGNRHPCVVFGMARQNNKWKQTIKQARKFQKMGYDVYFASLDDVYMLAPREWQTYETCDCRPAWW